MIETILNVIFYFGIFPALFFAIAHAMTTLFITRDDCLVTSYEVIPPLWLLRLLKRTDVLRMYSTIEVKHQFKFRLEGLVTFLFFEIPIIAGIIVYYFLLFIDFEMARDLGAFFFRYYAWYFVIMAFLGIVRIIIKYFSRFI